MTKINIRSPFYLNYSEPALPSVALDCTLINLTGLEIDQFGNVSLPTSDYGEIAFYSSTDSDFSDGKFDTVVSATSRTITFEITIPQNFSNSADERINCTATATQPAFTCTGGVTLNGSIPSQSLDSGGDSVVIDVSTYFTAGVDPIGSFTITNNNQYYVTTSLSGSELTIFSTNRTGTAVIYVEASDGNGLTCNATQSISITVSSAVTYDCSNAFFVGGGISNTGVITNPSVNGTITAIKDTSGGTPITSYPANNTGSARSVTLFFDITVPSGFGFTNQGATVECSKPFTQSSTALPEFTCELASLSNQAIAENGTIKVGTTNLGTIASFSPLSFSTVSSDTQRTVTFQITPPASGYSNSGGSNISCPATPIQPSTFEPQQGTIIWYYNPLRSNHWSFLTIDQYEGAGYDDSIPLFQREEQVLEYHIEYDKALGGTSDPILLQSTNILDNIGTYVFTRNGYELGLFIGTKYVGTGVISNPTDGHYIRVSKTFMSSTYYTSLQYGSYLSYIDSFPQTYYLKVEQNSQISEIWEADLVNKNFNRLA